MALHALRILRALGKDVPRDVSIVGFGDLLRTDLTDPPLTTVAVPYEEMGQEAVRLLLESSDAKELESLLPGHGQTYPIPTRLTIRHSTASPR